ncbi:MAG: VCBS repeat-containing protein [Verrucomicrobiae bacterium]|nr:VCBS repeat-containing protein [Verrucomicrobiae bacterium]
MDAIFELCVRDVGTMAKFYRDGLGMREVEATDPKRGALLEWAGSYLRLRPAGVNRDVAAPEEGGRSLMKQMLAKNGFRWFSLWYEDPSATGDRLVEAGYERPVKGGNVSMTHDPEGNIVEIMRIPRSASGETFTWGMAAGDENASRAFYRDVLGLPEFDPWNLPSPFSMKMYLFQTGNGRIKFSVPSGQRPNEADAGPDAPGLRSVTLRVKDLATAREGLAKRGAKVQEKEGRLLVTDRDGNRFYIAAVAGGPPPAPKPAASARAAAPEQAPGPPAAAANPEVIFRRLDANGDGRITAGELPRAELLARVDRDGDGTATLAEVRAYYAQQGRGASAKPVTDAPPTAFLSPVAPGEPPLKPLPDSDASRDAAGRGQLFESIHVANLTDLRAGMNGVAIADLNRDGLLDIVATFSPARGTGDRWGKAELLRVFVNEGGFKFRAHAVTLRDSKFTTDNFGRGQVPGLADFNNDGLLDLFVTRHARMEAGKTSTPGVDSPGNSLFLADGAWDAFREMPEAMGARNEEAYNRQPCFGDVNRDGFLDIAIGCDNIKNAMGGVPHSRLYIFRPGNDGFPGGKYEDIGGTDLVADFGGFYHDSAKDKAGPDIDLRDLDNDGDLDLIQSFHVDVREPLLPYWPGEYRQGVFCWKNLLAETGKLKFEKVTGNGLACEARLKYDREKQIYVPEGKAPGLPYVSMADVDNDGLMDLLAVGPASSGWAPRAEYVGGRFWRNLGDFRFEERTRAAGFESLEWTFREWVKFFEFPVSEDSLRVRPGKLQTQPGRDRPHPLDNRPYFADAAFADFNNDGWIDVAVQDRHEGIAMPARAILFMNRGDGTFEPKPTTFSGLDGNGICFEAADLNNDGLVDLVMAADPDNSGVATTPDRYESKVYWNTGLHGAKDNHWLRLRFSGITDALLVGARVEVFAVDRSRRGDEADGNRLLSSTATKRLGGRTIASNHSYKSGGALEAHIGLGKATSADVRVTLPVGKTATFADVKADQFLDLNLKTEHATQVRP